MKNANGNKYRLGLDLGTNSIGWAAVSLDDKGEPRGVLDMGVRIFPDGRDEQSKTSNAAARRVARGQRRRRDRYKQRRNKLMDALTEFGLMPGSEDQRKEIQQLDPYALRRRALDQALEPFELGRALFHLDQRRGFKSNRKAEGGDVAEGKSLSDRIGDLRRSIEESGARTLGEFMARRHETREAVRARPELGLYPARAMYREEFDAIRKAQEPHHTLSVEQWARLSGIIFSQGRLRSVEPGWCQFEYENKEKRAAKALPAFQEFRILQEVNNLRVQVGTEPERPLKDQERERALNRLRSGKPIDLEKATGLKLPPGAVLNLSRGGRKNIKGDETTARLAASGSPAKGDKSAKPGLFGKKWLDFSLDERNEIVKFLLDTEEPEAVRKKAVEEWGLNKEQAEAVANVSLAPGYGDLSEKAIGKLLPHLEQGIGYSEAVQAAGYSHHSDFRNEEAHETLPYYGKVLPRDVVGADPSKDPEKDGKEARWGRFPNPTVHIGLNQLRRVVNRLIEVYGKPEGIVVELTRELKSNREQLRRYERDRREGGKRNEQMRKDLEAAEQEPTPDLLRKLRLWKEQKDPGNVLVCPYTGQTLSFQMVISDQTEVDHILPFSRTLDNSAANMVVCVAAANRYKGDRAPHEAFGHSPEGYDYQEILSRTANFPPNKRWRFLENAIKQFEEGDWFLDRQLNETGYLSRTARTYLAYLYDEKGEGQCVWASPGRVTALLRRGWGLTGLLRDSDEGETRGKQRDDHRHHAIDAFVVACTTRSLLQRFARASGSSHNPEERLAAVAGQTSLPWEGFHRNQLKPYLDRLVVSYKPDHGTRGASGKTTGQLHEDTAFGLVELSEYGPSLVVSRKKLSAFKKRSDLDDVRDPVMGKALLELWDKVAAEDGKPADFAERAATEGVLLENGRRQTVRRVRVLERQTIIPIKDRDEKPYKGYKPGGNEFAEVWEMPDKRKTWKIVAVPTFYANQPDFDITNFRPHPAAKRVMRLYKNDMGALGEGEARRIVRVRKFSDGNVMLDDHNESNVDRRERRKTIQRNSGHSASKLRTEGFRKVGVNEIGRVRDPGPRKP